ncbi:alpha/beta hydrolase-fold protein [Nannocystis pusilla]|uniref:Alpha/beta hydrolase-fold protein n=1 Tax=Nannocystis pusilla TaxID=889268 RepID=A0A9X3EQL6_9BACT|nr:alpha/beta hydrolase-fold protein [Nannocystis pusilla]MCY1004896.1 alpha/beta hydrolase-fold protein [Nannocystis pusilla]
MATHVIYKLGPFSLPKFAGERHVRVYLPTERSDAPLPVLYIFDGQNIFHDDPSMCGGWYLHHAAHDLHAIGKPAPVIVGIDHGGADRIHELSPFAWEDSRGEADHLIDWVTDELAPRIQREFTVRSDAPGTAIGGSSMGGLAALYAHFRRPDVFGAALCMSPSLWVADRQIYDKLGEFPRPTPSRIYVDAGAHEGDMLSDAERLVSQLRPPATATTSSCGAPIPTAPTPSTTGASAPPRPSSGCSPRAPTPRPATPRDPAGLATQPPGTCPRRHVPENIFKRTCPIRHVLSTIHRTDLRLSPRGLAPCETSPARRQQMRPFSPDLLAPGSARAGPLSASIPARRLIDRPSFLGPQSPIQLLRRSRPALAVASPTSRPHQQAPRPRTELWARSRPAIARASEPGEPPRHC